MTEFNFKAIGYVRSIFKEKFAVPRQSGLVDSVESVIEVIPPYGSPEAFRELSTFSHAWLLFVFHHCVDKPWRATVRPPRLGGNERVGVFASRSPFRPNPVGLSAVRLLGIEYNEGASFLRVQGADLVDGTPIIDIKPYVPYADQINAEPGYTSAPEPVLTVEFTETADVQLAQAEQRLQQPVREIVREVLALDPRPAYRDKTGAGTGGDIYGVRLFDFNLRFRVDGKRLRVEALQPEPG